MTSVKEQSWISFVAKKQHRNKCLKKERKKERKVQRSLYWIFFPPAFLIYVSNISPTKRSTWSSCVATNIFFCPFFLVSPFLSEEVWKLVFLKSGGDPINQTWPNCSPPKLFCGPFNEPKWCNTMFMCIVL